MMAWTGTYNCTHQTLLTNKLSENATCAHSQPALQRTLSVSTLCAARQRRHLCAGCLSTAGTAPKLRALLSALSNGGSLCRPACDPRTDWICNQSNNVRSSVPVQRPAGRHSSLPCHALWVGASSVSMGHASQQQNPHHVLHMCQVSRSRLYEQALENLSFIAEKGLVDTHLNSVLLKLPLDQCNQL